MRIKNLSISNFGLFENDTFDLDDPFVVIYGPNFTGKSTLAQAIYYAFCGKPLISGIKPKEMVTNNRKTASVDLTLTSGDHLFHLNRDQRGTGKMKQLLNGAWNDVSDRLSEFPGMNPEQMKIGCFLKEDELGEFITQKPASRRDLLNQILGIKQLLQIQERFIETRKYAKRVEKDYNARLSNSKTDRVEDCRFALETARKELEQLEYQLSMTEVDPDIQKNSQLFKELTASRQRLKDRIETKQTMKSSLLKGFANGDELRHALTEIQARQEEFPEYQRRLEELIEKRATINAGIQQAKNIVEKMQHLEGKAVCPTCQQQVTTVHIEQVQAEYGEQLEQDRDRLADIQDQEAQIRETISLFNQMAQREKMLRENFNQLKNIDEELEELVGQFKNVEKKIASLQPPASAPSNLDELRAQTAAARSQVSQLETRQQMYDTYTEKMSTYTRQLQESTHARLKSEWVADAMEKTLSDVIGRALDPIKSRITYCLDAFDMFDQQYVSLELERLKLMPEVDKRNFQTLSSSEKAILYLAMKVGLSSLMPGADFFVFDNPTVHLDHTRQQTMANYLTALSSEKQVIVLTNDLPLVERLEAGKRIDL